VPAIAEILVDTWRTTFRGIVADDFLDAMLYEQQHERLLNILDGEGTTCFIAEVSNVPVGFAMAGPNRGTKSFYSGELYAIYVRQSFQARGIGKQLLGAISRELIAQQRAAMIVWVLAVNPFRAFYEQLGAHIFDRQGLMLGTQMVEQIAYVWDDLRALADRLSEITTTALFTNA
jgi:GNAT superfamily N-acetyltransferase